MNNKGDIQSIIIMVVILFIGAIVSIIFVKGFHEGATEMKNEPFIAANERAMDAITVADENAVSFFDLLILCGFIGLFIGLIISVIYIDVHPALTFVFILALIVAVFLASQFSNVFYEFKSDSEIASTAAQFTFTNIILGNKFPLIILMVGVITTIVLYAKSKKSEQLAT